MPWNGKPKITEAQRVAVAQGRIAGKTAAEISAEVGLTPGTVAHVVVGPEVKGIIARAMVAQEPKLFRLMAKLVDSLEAEIDPEGKNSYEQRERARAQAMTMLQLGQPKVVEPPPGANGAPGGAPGMFLGDMLTVYRTAVLQAQGGPQINE